MGLSYAMPFLSKIALIAAMLSVFILPGCRKFGNFWDNEGAAGKQTGPGGNPTIPAGPISGTMPTSGSYRNNTQVSYTFSDNCSSASITWVRTGGAADAGGAPAGTHTQALTGPELLSGAHNNITLTNNPTLADGAIYTVTFACTDMALNVLSPVVATGVTYDTTLPVITVTAPASTSYRTTTNVDYSLSEACQAGSITWTQTGGTADPGSPRVQALSGAELALGAHSNITLANNPALVDGAIYSVAFNCTDLAGNIAATITRTNVSYDFTTPVISSVSPSNGAVLNHKQIGYTFSETCAGGNVTWTRTGGTADGGSPHVQALTGAELNAGAHGPATITNNPPLVSGAVYTITFNCTDAAGLVATAVTVTSVTFDNTAPVISGILPLDSAFRSTTQVSFDFTENCASASITWTRTGGSPDGGGAPPGTHTQALTAGELTAGLHSNITITNNPTLIDGTVYSMAFNCTDAAGNVATTVNRTNITYDPSAVVISAVSPATNAFVNNKLVNYTFSEACATAQVQWSRTGGSADGASPHNMALTAGDLTSGAHTGVNLNPPIVDGAIYTITFSCTDAAANVSTPIVITGVTYDVTVPVISAVSPASSSAVNHQQVGYTFSEACASATVTWTYVSGAASGNFNQGLTGGELTAGPHGPSVITNNPTLVTGATYNIAFNCTDAAGNAAVAVTQTNVTFDNTPPTISIQNLRNNSMVHTGHVIGQANDPVGTMLNVQFQLDGGAWTAATYTAPNWKFALPMGPSTWKDRSPHTINVRANDTAGNVTTAGMINVRKGNNRDVNGDGYEDLAIGASVHTSSTGKVYLFYGASGGIGPALATAAPAIFTGEATTNSFGRNIVMADFNGDGFGDMAVGAAGYSSTFGRAYIFNGSVSGITGMAASAAPTKISGTTNYNLGATLAAGDTNGDGYADLGVTAIAVTSTTGAAYIFHGGAGGITATSYTTANTTITGESTTNSFGTAMVLADLNNDGFSDAAICASGYSGNTGRAYIFMSAGASGIANGAAGPTKAMTTGETASDYFCSSIVAGDVNGDGLTDLAVASYNFSGTTGKAYLFQNPGGGFALNNATTPTSTFLGETALDTFSTSISMSDLNADGYSDLIVGAYGYTGNAGRTYIFPGSGSGIASIPASSAAYKITGTASPGWFGRGVGALDVNGDGYPDLISGGPYVNSQYGAANIFHSNASFTAATFSSGATRIIDGDNTSAGQFGISISR